MEMTITIGKRMAAVALGVFSLFAGPVGAWEYYPGLAAPGVNGIVVGDFDGNGKPEAVVTDDTRYDNWDTGSRLLTLLAADSAGRLDIRGVVMLPVDSIERPIVWGRPGLGDRLVVSARTGSSIGQILVMGGVPLQVLRTIDIPTVQRVVAVADVDADGQPEIVALTGSSFWSPLYPTILDYATGSVKWMSSEPASDVVVGQFDGDAALELVLASTPGRVIDGATHAVEWSYAGGFGERLLIGRFGNDDKLGFATVANSRDRVQVFRSQPYSPVSEIKANIPSGVGSMATVRMTPSGADQIAIGNASWQKLVTIFDPRSGAELLSVDGQQSYFEVNAIAASDLDGDGRSELVIGSREISALRVVDLGTLQDDYVKKGAYGSYSAVARGDLQGNGGDQVAVLYRSGGSYDRGANVFVLDSGSGSLLRSREGIFTSYSSSGVRIAIGQLDTDAQKEIVLVGAEYNDGMVVAIDGNTLEEQWRVNKCSGSISPVGSNSPTGLALIDVNGDGKDDVVVTTYDGRIVVLNGINGGVLWQSITLSGATAASLATFRAPGGAPRAVVGRGAALYVFDLASHLLVTSMSTSASVIGVWQWGNGDACRIAALDAASVATLYRCDTLAVAGQQLLPQGTEFMRPLDAQGSRFIGAADAYLYEVTPDGTAIPTKGPIGRQLGSGNQGDVRVEPDGQHFDVTIGSDYMVTRIRVGRDAIFANGFD